MNSDLELIFHVVQTLVGIVGFSGIFIRAGRYIESHILLEKKVDYHIQEDKDKFANYDRAILELKVDAARKRT